MGKAELELILNNVIGGIVKRDRLRILVKKNQQDNSDRRYHIRTLVVVVVEIERKTNSGRIRPQYGNKPPKMAKTSK